MEFWGRMWFHANRSTHSQISIDVITFDQMEEDDVNFLAILTWSWNRKRSRSAAIGAALTTSNFISDTVYQNLRCQDLFRCCLVS